MATGDFWQADKSHIHKGLFLENMLNYFCVELIEPQRKRDALDDDAM
jgi:hypothetical protein